MELTGHKRTVLKALEANGADGVCGTTFLDLYVPRYSAVLFDLKALGYSIGRRRCTDQHHRTTQYRWYLEDRGQTSMDLVT